LLQVVLSTLIGSVRGRSLAPLKKSRDTLPAAAGQVLLDVVFLAYRAVLLLDAEARTLVRLFVTRRKLLEWETAASTEQRLGAGLLHFVAVMWPAPALALTIGLLSGAVRPASLAAATPFLAAWLISPYVAFRVSWPRPIVQTPLSDQERRALRRIARKTWRFFETFVGDDDHWLPPDNFQEIPDGRVAHRTSPTNKGLLLLSTLAAHDLGYIGLGTLVDRLERTFDTLNRLEKHWGHFYNWYQTQTLQPLPPRYISTVDSGNLLGCLLTLVHGLREKTEVPVLGPVVIHGLADTLALAVEEGLGAAGQVLGDLLEAPPGDLAEWDRWLEVFERQAVELAGHGSSQPKVAASSPGSKAAVASPTWADRLVDQVRAWRAELAVAAPWLGALRAWETHPEGHSATLPAGRSGSAIRTDLVAPASLAAITERAERLSAELAAGAAATPAADELLQELLTAVRDPRPAALLDRLRRLTETAENLAAAMDFRPLYRPERRLFAIGCNLVQGRLDNACYDLLASESCLTSYLAVARGEAPRRHWFQLGRPFIRAARQVGLISWGGTMFEYLMPRLLLRSLPGTLLAEACRTAVARQVEYGRSLGLPWGISESAFSAQFLDGDYQYQAFGVPGLGLKQGLDQDRVIAPYATAMATMLAPREALANFRRLTQEGAEGEFGYYEAIDYTPDRLPRGRRSVVVKSYMAHHQGMSLVALTNTLLADVMSRRFQAEPRVRAIGLLLQERVPRDAPLAEAHEGARTMSLAASPESTAGPMNRRLTTPNTPVPRTHLLSNSQYHVMITNAGSGFSTCRGLAMTRWREDPTRDAWGQFCYVRDLQRNVVWSAGYQPICRTPESYEVIFAADKATFRRRDLGIETTLEVMVSPEHRAEIRRVTLSNHDAAPHELELTSYVEVVLGPHASDLAHPSFGKLFLETEWVPGPQALLCRRRTRSDAEQPLWAVHVAAVDGSAAGGAVVGDTQFETDRARFLGRGRTPAAPAALEPGAVLSGTAGPVLDPVLSLRRRFRIKPGGSAIIALTTAFAESRAEALTLADQYREASAASRAFELAWAHSQVEHRHHNRSGEDAHLFQRLASHVLLASGALRADAAVLLSNQMGQPDLWRFGISGDRPIILAQIEAADDLPLARQLLAAQEFLRLKGLDCDLVLLDEEPVSYREERNQQLQELVRAAVGPERTDRRGGVFVLKASQLSHDEKALLQAAARVVLFGDRGSLASQLDRTERHPPLPARLIASRDPGAWDDEPVRLPADLRLPNGFGGFTPDGREYCLLVPGQAVPDSTRNGPPVPYQAVPGPRLPPAPWVNVVANPGLGFVVSESGSGFTWAGNSQSNRLTPWSNDPVSDPPGEVVYLRDEETSEVWCPTPGPVRSGQPTLIRHGQGYTVFERNTHGLSHELTVFVPPDDPIKLIRLRIKNAGDRPRRLSATYYAEWVLGLTRDAAAMHVVTEIDSETGALLARNAFRPDFATHVAFADVDRRPRSMTADRASFLGRHGSVAGPAALGRVDLAERTGAALDPCAALRVAFALEPGAQTQVLFLLGEADGVDSARVLIRRYRDEDRAERVLQNVRTQWDARLEVVQVHTPEPALDLLVNRWLLYQVLGCRYWARSAFYQSGGAYGFRDQLQDVMALVHAAPAETRAHLLRAAGRQFLEGDVQHWWHPPSGRGIRTRIADDPLWLPFVTSYYVTTTGDRSVLDEPVPYLQGPLLKPDQEDDYGLPALAQESGSLYDHCLRALNHANRLGAHGLPLMGHGDWNDGMNRVGNRGLGESVWLAWFSIACLNQFAELAEARGESGRSAGLRRQAEALRAAVEAHAWDGRWYRRAFFDDGTPLGSAQNQACRIDSIAQSWAVLSGAADPVRARQALEAVSEYLVDREGRLILLFAPPFDAQPLDPGYIKGYLPGVRENGGQYTHAATWVVQAAALLGQGRRSFEWLQLLNPIRHAEDPQGVERYKVEPYAVAGDVYSCPPHVGRGGWTWYTGSAAWLYRAILESILGLQRRGDRLAVDPRIPPEWGQFEMIYRLGSATYRIQVENPQAIESGVVTLWLDGQPQPESGIHLVDDGQSHAVRVVMEPATEPRPSESESGSTSAAP
jgi:cyclic beta-1,2-glucan synthetase